MFEENALFEVSELATVNEIKIDHDTILETKDAELREKQSALENSAAHEKTFAQLMQQLAVESQALMAELWQKNELVAELENKTHRSFDNGFMLDQSGALQERLL